MRASRVVDGFGVVVADSQYSSKRVRDCVVGYGAESVIPYPLNHRRGESVLRVDRFFRTSGSASERRVYEVGRASVERVNSRLEFVGLECLKLRGLRRVRVHVLLCNIVMFKVAVYDSGSFLCGGYAVAREVLVPPVKLRIVFN